MTCSKTNASRFFFACDEHARAHSIDLSHISRRHRDHHIFAKHSHLRCVFNVINVMRNCIIVRLSFCESFFLLFFLSALFLRLSRPIPNDMYAVCPLMAIPTRFKSILFATQRNHIWHNRDGWLRNIVMLVFLRERLFGGLGDWECFDGARRCWLDFLEVDKKNVNFNDWIVELWWCVDELQKFNERSWAWEKVVHSYTS